MTNNQNSPLLLIPGPTPVPDQVLKAINTQPLPHRSAEFSAILNDAIDNLKWLAETQNDCFIFTGSGTLAMEASIVNFINPGDSVLALNIGVFSERLAQIAQGITDNVITLKAESGCAIELDQVELALSQNKNIKAVLITHNETSTAVMQNLPALAKICQKHNALTIVDAITSFAASPVLITEWGLDVVITGSQKALMLPPGLSIIFVSKRAWEYVGKNKNPKFYLDLNKYKKSMLNKTTPFTPNVSLIAGLNVALKLIAENGKEATYDRHLKLRKLVRSLSQKYDFELLVEDESIASPSVTAFKAADRITVSDLRSNLKNNHNIIIADGQNDLKGKIFRVGHMGYMFEADILRLDKALGQILA